MSPKTHEMAPDPVVPTCGEVFTKDLILEIVRSEARNARPRLLTWNGKHATLVEQFTVNGVTYVPLDLGAAIGRALLLPTGAAEMDRRAYYSTKLPRWFHAPAACRITP